MNKVNESDINLRERSPNYEFFNFELGETCIYPNYLIEDVTTSADIYLDIEVKLIGIGKELALVEFQIDKKIERKKVLFSRLRKK